MKTARIYVRLPCGSGSESLIGFTAFLVEWCVAVAETCCVVFGRFVNGMHRDVVLVVQ